jgi:fermentation-respiration switch protein FrsA (DUF1100 family)
MVSEPISWKSDHLKISGEIYLPEKGKRPPPGLIICHGIPAKNKGPDDRGYPLLAEQFCREGFLVLIFNFRGAGISEGDFDLRGWAQDLEGALNYLAMHPDADPKRIYLLGFSGGAAVSIYVAARRKEVRGLVSCASPADFHDLIVGQGLIDFLAYAREVGIIRDPLFPPSLSEWRRSFETVQPINWIKQIPPRPLLLIHGTADEVVEVRHAHLLCEEVRGQAECFLIEKAGHRLRLDEQAMKKARDWLRKEAFCKADSAIR